MGAQQTKERSSGGVGPGGISPAGGSNFGAGSTLRASRIKPRSQKESRGTGSNIFTEHSGKPCQSTFISQCRLMFERETESQTSFAHLIQKSRLHISQIHQISNLTELNITIQQTGILVLDVEKENLEKIRTMESHFFCAKLMGI